MATKLTDEQTETIKSVVLTIIAASAAFGGTKIVKLFSEVASHVPEMTLHQFESFMRKLRVEGLILYTGGRWHITNQGITERLNGTPVDAFQKSR
jgi:hypothetical protein